MKPVKASLHTPQACFMLCGDARKALHGAKHRFIYHISPLRLDR